MNISKGSNPMRWNCLEQGCFNVKCRPKIEHFSECFPRNINFGDVDGLVELNGRFCLLEWKHPTANLRSAQSISFSAFTAIPGNCVFVVHGYAQTMDVNAYSVFWNGKQFPAVRASLDDLKQRIRKWANYAETIEYDAQDDIRKSVIVGFEAIRDRKAAGGAGWPE